MLRAALLLSLVPLVTCGPVPVEVAERQCADRARQALGPTGHAQFGISSDGHRVRPIARTEISLGVDFLAGRDPQKVYTTCVFDRSGHPPTRPLVL